MKQTTATDLYHYESQLWKQGYHSVMGLDEVGRGCLAGPVVAAGVIIEPDNRIDGLGDSKQLTAETRLKLAERIKSQARIWSIRQLDAPEVDRLNIYWAAQQVMKQCAHASQIPPDFLLIDGQRYSDERFPYECVVKGDRKSASIGAASILAKVYRDALMMRLHKYHPHYGWDSNVGYPTPRHYEGIRQHGITVYHRRSFRLHRDSGRRA